MRAALLALIVLAAAPAAAQSSKKAKLALPVVTVKMEGEDGAHLKAALRKTGLRTDDGAPAAYEILATLDHDSEGAQYAVIVRDLAANELVTQKMGTLPTGSTGADLGMLLVPELLAYDRRQRTRGDSFDLFAENVTFDQAKLIERELRSSNGSVKKIQLRRLERAVCEYYGKVERGAMPQTIADGLDGAKVGPYLVKVTRVEKTEVRFTLVQPQPEPSDGGVP